MQDEIVAKHQALISQYGWSATCVFGGGEPNFTYTIGVSKNFDHPEIIIVGFTHELSHSLISEAVSAIRRGSSFADPCLSDEINPDYLAAFRPLSGESVSQNTGIARAVLGHTPEAVQMFLPDVDGHFPWVAECKPEMARIQTSLFEAVGPLPGSREARMLKM